MLWLFSLEFLIPLPLVGLMLLVPLLPLTILLSLLLLLVLICTLLLLPHIRLSEVVTFLPFLDLGQEVAISSTGGDGVNKLLHNTVFVGFL